MLSAIGQQDGAYPYPVAFERAVYKQAVAAEYSRRSTKGDVLFAKWKIAAIAITALDIDVVISAFFQAIRIQVEIQAVHFLR